MKTYSIHYRLDKEKIGQSYDRRYKQLQDAIARVAGDREPHVDVTSTVWISTDESAESIAKTLKLAVDPRFDVVLVKFADAPMIYAVGDSVNPTEFELHTGILVAKI
ncbi:hypothetical protein [Achromobacter ruhlandii]|uniref:hypothetical protein n=1 Tax=Achromobacter ruhlandii TaxID=72557 RepID=UPI000C261812|nr:hypothetical protein [Achromobacter ruhlandii]PJM72095.1 hypothetical protein CV751_03380 [Achromobacter ruhlandii]